MSKKSGHSGGGSGKLSGEGNPIIGEVPAKRDGLHGRRRQVVQYTFLFVCLLIVVILGTLMVWRPEKLVANDLVGHFNYVMVVILGLAAAGGLFILMPSTASYKGNQFGGVLKLGGPVVLFVIVLLIGIERVKRQDAFSLTVYVHGEAGPHDLVLRRGKVLMTVGPDRREAEIGVKGEAYFSGIPASFRGQEVPISVEAAGFETVNPGQPLKLEGASLYVKVRAKAVRLTGRVRNGEGRPVAKAAIRVGELHTDTDDNGYFSLTLPGAGGGNEINLEVAAAGFQTWHQLVTPSGTEMGIVLQRER